LKKPYHADAAFFLRAPLVPELGNWPLFLDEAGKEAGRLMPLRAGLQSSWPERKLHPWQRM